MLNSLILIGFHLTIVTQFWDTMAPSLLFLLLFLFCELSPTRAILLSAISFIFFILFFLFYDYNRLTNLRLKVFYLPCLNKGYKVCLDPCLKSKYTNLRT